MRTARCCPQCSSTATIVEVGARGGLPGVQRCCTCAYSWSPCLDCAGGYVLRPRVEAVPRFAAASVATKRAAACETRSRGPGQVRGEPWRNCLTSAGPRRRRLNRGRPGCSRRPRALSRTRLRSSKRSSPRHAALVKSSLIVNDPSVWHAALPIRVAAEPRAPRHPTPGHRCAVRQECGRTHP